MADKGPGQDPSDGASDAARWQARGLAATAALRQTWGSLAEVTHELSANEWALATPCPGWDVKDQLSHLIGIELAIMGEKPPEWDQPLGEHVKNDFAAINEKFVAVRRARTGPEVHAEFAMVTAQRVAQLDALTADEWAVVGFSPVGQVPYAQFMEVRVFDSWVHEQDVREALDRPGGTGNAASAMALDRVQNTMAFVVAKKAGAPDGSVVRFDVAGPGDDSRSFAVAVEGGRGKAAPDGTAASTVLTLSSLDFSRLGCGRATAAQVEAAGGIGVEGDAATGQRVLHAMNFMF